MKWERLTSAEIDACDRNTPVILNLAAIEQHGAHLPLGTDADIGGYMLDQLDQAQPDAQLILPAIKVCYSAHHMDFPGTLTVSHAVLKDYVCDILSSVVTSGFRNILLFNSHGGNQAIGQVIVEDFGNRHPACRVALVTWWSLVQKELRALSETGQLGTGHACELETSIMLAAGLADPDTPLPPGTHHTDTFDWATGSMLYPPRAALYRSMKDISGGSGVVGQPDKASAAKGAQITGQVVSALSQVVKDLATPHQPRVNGS